MTEIKLGLSLAAEAGLMRWGLDTEKNYRDIFFKESMPYRSSGKGIFDELADSLKTMEKAKAKVVALIDTWPAFYSFEKVHLDIMLA